MKAETYFEKTGKVYGVSSKFEFGAWSHRVREFNNWGDAQEWLHTEGRDFRERELMSKSRAIKLVGSRKDFDADVAYGNELAAWEREWA